MNTDPKAAAEPEGRHEASMPKSKAQEWTAETVFDLLGSDYGEDGWKRERNVAHAHNASIAAERERANNAFELSLSNAKLAKERLKPLAAAQAIEQSLIQLRRKITCQEIAQADAVIALGRTCLWRLREEKRAIIDAHGESAVPAYLNRCIHHLSDFANQPADTTALDAAIAAATKEQWKILIDEKHRAICVACGYPELIGSDDCRNCGNNFSSDNRIAIGAAAKKPLVDALEAIKELSGPRSEAKRIAYAALAKVKEG